MAYSDITAYVAAAQAAIAAGDYATARNNVIAAQLGLAALPDTQRSAGDGGQQGVSFDRVAMTQTLATMQRLLNSATGIQVSKARTCPVQGSGPPQLGIW